MPRAVILTALPVEYLAVRTHLTDLQEEIHSQGTVYERGKFVANGQTWEVGIAEVGAGNAGAAVEAERAISYFKPDILFFVGIAGGIKDVAIGDVVAATKVYSYDSGKVGEQFFARPALGQSAHALVQRARAEARKGEWLERLLSSSPSQPRVFVAPIAAGEKVVASKESDVFNFIRASYNDAIAVEMEGFGFLSAAFAYPNIKAIVIRGISDLIKDKNANDPVEGTEEERQERASRNSSAFAFEILSKLEIASQDLRESHQETPTPATSLQQRQRLEQRQEALQTEWNLRSEKLKQLRQALAIEAGVATKFQLEKQIQDEEKQLSQLENELSSLEQALQAPDATTLDDKYDKTVKYPPRQPTAKPAHFLDDQVFQLMPLDIGTIWGLQRSSFIGVLISFKPCGVYENLKDIESILSNALETNQSTIGLPKREWMQLDITKYLNQVSQNEIVNGLRNDSFPGSSIPGFFFEIDVKQLDANHSRQIRDWCYTLINELFPRQPVAIIVNITGENVNQAIRTFVSQLREIARQIPIELMHLDCQLFFENNISELKVVNANPIDISEKPGFCFCRWIYHALAHDSLREKLVKTQGAYKTIINLYKEVKKQYSEEEIQDNYPEVTASDIVLDIKMIVSESLEKTYDELLHLIINFFPQWSCEWVSTYVKSKIPEAVHVALNIAANAGSLSDILMDAWVNTINLDVYDLNSLCQNGVIAPDFNHIHNLKLEGLFLALLRRERTQDNPKNQIILRELVRKLPSFQALYDLYQNQSKSEEEFLKQNDANQFMFAIRAKIKLDQTINQFKTVPFSHLSPAICWLLAAMPPGQDELAELLQLEPEKRAIFGLCTSQEWHQIQKKSDKERRVLDCRRDRLLIYSPTYL